MFVMCHVAHSPFSGSSLNDSGQTRENKIAKAEPPNWAEMTLERTKPSSNRNQTPFELGPKIEEAKLWVQPS